jgi:hypothetical protein
MGSIRVVRWIIVALSAALSVALIAHGNLIVGVIIGALALSRAALLIGLQRRRRRFRRRVGMRNDKIGEDASRFF